MTGRKTRMTAEQRRAHEEQRRAYEEQRWQAEKHRRILHVLHRASELGFQIRLDTELGAPGEICVIIDGTNEKFGWRKFFVGSISEWTMSKIENDLKLVEDQRNEEFIRRRRNEEFIRRRRNEEFIRRRKRQAILDRLTAEERELLGV